MSKSAASFACALLLVCQWSQAQSNNHIDLVKRLTAEQGKMVDTVMKLVEEDKKKTKDKDFEHFNGFRVLDIKLGVAGRDNTRVGSVVVYSQIDFRDEDSSGSAGVNILLATEICPRLDGGRLSVRTQSYMADVRPFDSPPIPADKGQDEAMKKVNKDGERKMAAMNASVETTINGIISSDPDIQRIDGRIARIRIDTLGLLVLPINPKDSWTASSVDGWAPVLDDKALYDHWGLTNDYQSQISSSAALVVIAFAKDTQRAVFNDNPQKPFDPNIFKRDVRGAIRLHLQSSFHYDNLGASGRELNGQCWGNEISTIVVLPGLAYRGHRLRLFQHDGKSARDGKHGKVLTLTPGWYSLNLAQNQNMDDATTQLDIVQP